MSQHQNIIGCEGLLTSRSRPCPISEGCGPFKVHVKIPSLKTLPKKSPPLDASPDTPVLCAMRGHDMQQKQMLTHKGRIPWPLQ
mmetsp:Transcript_98322/g.194838  ORF Transcript_98322/g.194838 Transcript_98322/m.194838 type:complete len:84 (-) Transcript_98322:1493-1744(-)